MIILTEFYEPKNEEHYEEILTCISNNLENKYVSRIYLFVSEEDKNKIPEIPLFYDYREKLYAVVCISRPTFSTFFKYCKTIDSEENMMICNSDIYFDNSLELLENENLENKFVLLNRYEGEVVYDVPYSQDTWIFKKGLDIDADFKLGTPGCDNKIAYLALIKDYMVVNPSLLIKSYHLHKDMERFHTERCDGPYLLSWPSDSFEISRLEVISDFKSWFSRIKTE